MPWFPVDDSFYSHPKVLATSLAARGLWVTAGAWSSACLTDGAVPGHVLASLGGTPELAAELVAAGLWRRTRKGYVFHDWLQWGSKRTADEIRALRKLRAESGRKGGLASGKTRANRQANPKQLASLLVDGGLNPNTNTKELTPLTPAADAAGEHDGRHRNCRACGTNPRGQPPPTPVPPPYRAANGQPARGDAVAALAAQARQAIAKEA